IDDVSLEDPLFAAPHPVVTPELVSGDANSNGKLDVGETWTYTAAYAITQTDLDAGGVWNLAVAKGKDPKGGDVEDESADPDPLAPGDPGYDEDCADCTVTELPQSPSMELLKSSAYVDTNTDEKVNVGDHINYTFTLENTGNVTIDDVSLEDPLLAAPNPAVAPELVSGDTNEDGKLDVGETLIYTEVHAITQTDMDARGVTYLATAKGKDTKGGVVTDEPEHKDH